MIPRHRYSTGWFYNSQLAGILGRKGSSLQGTAERTCCANMAGKTPVDTMMRIAAGEPCANMAGKPPVEAMMRIAAAAASARGVHRRRT